MKRAWHAVVTWWRAFLGVRRPDEPPIDQFGKPEECEAKPQLLEFHKPIMVDPDPEAEALAAMNERTAERSLQPGTARRPCNDAATIVLLREQFGVVLSELEEARALIVAMERPLHELQLRGFLPSTLRGADLAATAAACFLAMRDERHEALEKLRLQQKRTRASRAAKRKPKQTVSKAHGRRRTS